MADDPERDDEIAQPIDDDLVGQADEEFEDLDELAEKDEEDEEIEEK